MKKQMILGVGLGNNFGVHPGAWRAPGVDAGSYTDIGATVKQAQAAERGGLHFVFLADRLFLHGDLASGPPMFAMDPLITLAALAPATDRIGLIATASTSFTEPYLLARQLKALDVISHGRVGWNAVPSYEPDAFANFAKELPPREQKYERLHEVMQIVQALWGSWKPEAGTPDRAGTFANPAHLHSVDMQGRHVGARGPLPIPPSEQGQPVIVQPASSGYGLQAAGMYADVVIGMPSTIEEGRAQRDIVRHAAKAAGRDPEEIKFIAFAGYGVADTVREALDNRRALDDLVDLRVPLTRLAALLGMRQPIAQPDEPLTHVHLADTNTSPDSSRAAQARDLAAHGWTPRDILAHGVLDPYPSVIGTAENAADHLQEWFDADAADGFLLNFDRYHTGIDDFVDRVIPLLRQRQLFPDGHETKTLREHLGLPTRYGPDPRLR